MKIPIQYRWILDEPGTKMVQEFIKIYGTTEVPGAGDNPVILEWAKECGLQDVYKHDATAWCALTMAVIARRAGKELPPDPLWALNWALFGNKVTDGAMFGDVLVFKRNGGGHVGLYLGEDSECYHVGGGNQADTTSIVRKPKDRIYAIRRPDYTVQPACVRKIILSADGAIDDRES
jgi:uncharacterized protein (TIGR02594 family)